REFGRRRDPAMEVHWKFGHNPPAAVARATRPARREGQMMGRRTWSVVAIARVAIGIAAALSMSSRDVDAAIGTPQAVGSFGDRTASTTTQAIFTTNIPVGSTVIVTIALNPVAGTITCSDPRGNTYAVDVDVTQGTGTSGVPSAVCSARVTTAIQAGDLMTVGHTSNSRRAIVVMSVTGLAVNPVDKTATGIGSS